MRSILLHLLLPAAAATLKGTQYRKQDALNRGLKKEEDQPPIEIISTSSPTGKTAMPTKLPTLSPSGLPSFEPTIDQSDVPSVVPSFSISSEPSDVFVPDVSVNVTSSPSRAPSTKVSEVNVVVSTKSPTPSPVFSNTPSTELTSDDIGSVSIVPLKPFRVDFVSTIHHADNGSGRNLRAQDITQHETATSSARMLQVFNSKQDAELIHIISNHVRTYLQQEQPIGEVLAVQLKIVDKVESVFGKLDGTSDGIDSSENAGGGGVSEGEERKLRPELSLVLVSYTFEGEVLLANAAPQSLEEVMLRSFTGEEEQSSLLAALASSNDEVLRSITDVDATTVVPLEFVNGVLDSENTSKSDLESPRKVRVIFPTLIGIAFFSTLSALGFLVHRKYREYRSNEYTSYQQRKRNYNHFESDSSSITENVSPTSRDAETEAVFAYDFSIEESSLEDERGWSSTSTCTDTLDWNVPFDEHSLGARQMTYDDQTKMELRMIQMGTSKHDGIQPGTVRSVPVSSVDDSQTDATLDGLYSTTDSYFDTTTAKNRNRRCDSIDTLNSSTDQQAFGPGWEREVNFEGVLNVMDEKDLVTDVTKIFLQNCVTTEKSCGALETPKSKRQDKLQPENKKSPDCILSKQASSYKVMYTSADPAAQAKANISAGIFTQETLGMINRNRLKCTPPPSENEYDEDVVNDAKENTLLGKWTVDSDEDEDILFEAANDCN